MIRRLARPLLGAAFISSGIEALQGIDRRASRVEAYGATAPLTLTRAIAAAQLFGGLLLVANRMPRLTAGVLALTVVPEAATGHDFWTEKDPDAKRTQRSLFTRDIGLLGGLMVAAVEGGRRRSSRRAIRLTRGAGQDASGD